MKADQLATLDLLQNDIAAKQERLAALQAELETPLLVPGPGGRDRVGLQPHFLDGDQVRVGDILPACFQPPWDSNTAFADRWKVGERLSSVI